jgi:hypothetical protein
MTQLVINSRLGEQLPLANGTEGQVLAITSSVPAWSSSAASSAASDATPVADGVATAGVAITWSRSDHVHPQEAAAEITVGSSVIAGGTTGRVLYDNGGVLGEKAVTGTGNAVLATSPTLVTPTLGVATATKLTFATATAGLLGGSGATGARGALGATAGNALEFYLDATHTSGDMRANYVNLTFSGAGGSGEAGRFYSVVNNVTAATGGTVNGAHISLDFVGADAKISGAGNALRATFGISDATSTAVGGTCSTIQVDTFFDTAITVPANFAFLRFTNTGVKKSSNLIRVPNVAAESAGLFCAHTTQTMTHSLRYVSDNGQVYYIMCTNANTNRTEA